MHESDFNKLVEAAKMQNSRWFELEREPPATAAAIGDVERDLGVQLPNEYKRFLQTHGAGYFALALVLGVEEGTGWEIVEHARGLPDNFVPASDTETGDYYGFVVEGGVCTPRVAFWDHETETVQETAFPDFFDMMAVRSLNRR